MKLTQIIPVLLLALALVACGGSQAASEPMAAMAPTAGPAAAAPAGANGGGAAALEQGNTAPTAQDQSGQPQQQRLVIKTADIALQVDSAREAEAAVRGLAAQLGGYVVSVETHGADEYMTSRVTFRVPAQRFDQALTGVQGLAKKVISRTVSGDDVTEEFVDLESRLKNLEATRDRLQSFLDKANTVEDALKVNQSLSDIQGQIEQILGRKQYLQQSAALSTISVSLAPVPAIAPIVAEEGWQPVAVAREALRGLVSFGQSLATLAIVALVWAPVWLPLLLLLRWMLRKMRGRAAKPAAPSAPKAA